MNWKPIETAPKTSRDLPQESPLWRKWAESRNSVQRMRDELDRLRAENARLTEDHAAAKAFQEALK